MARQSEETTTSPRHKFHEVFQPKHGRYSELPPAKISEMLKSNSLDNAPTQSLLSVVNGILDESIERKNGEIPDRVACLLRKVVLEIERRISTQAEHIRNQNNLYKTREEKYQSRIRVLEALATGTSEEAQAVKRKFEESKKYEEYDLAKLMKEKEENDLMVAKLKGELEIKNKLKEEHRLQLENKVKEATIQMMKEKESRDLMLATLKAELEVKNRSCEQHYQNLETKIKESRGALMKEKEDNDRMVAKYKEEIQAIKESHNQHLLQLEADTREAKEVLMKDKEATDLVVAKLKEEIEIMNKSHAKSYLDIETKFVEEKEQTTKEKVHLESTIKELKEDFELKKKSYEEQCTQLNIKIKEVKNEWKEKHRVLEEKKNGAEFLLAEISKKTKQLEDASNSSAYNWKRKENLCHNFVEFQLEILKGLKVSTDSIKKAVVDAQKAYFEDFTSLGNAFKRIGGVAQNYDMVLTENRKLYNEVQELKGNIRVYCRIRPFLSGESKKSTTIDFIGEDGELLTVNPSKQGKDGQRMFKFNKVFGPDSPQEEVYLDTRPLIRSALDGFNVCIFAYGQTGSGKTYTMSGPTSSSKENRGVNYRALNDLFDISQNRKGTFTYAVEVQMVEIYNEQVRDLLSNDTSQKRLEIRNCSQSNGLAVPNAIVYPVNSTEDVLELMHIGQTNRAMSATALNERSSRSHSVVTVHVRGSDLKTGASLRGSLHLVDLAGSERVDRSEVTGDRLREAQHINKSLSALGDVISALSQKSSHVPYRNSKLTQLLQSCLGGHAKTLMFVQINPDTESYSETMSTLKFAERVSGVELGTARSNKDSKDVRELMEQVATLKDTISKKDEEIEKLRDLRELNSSHLSLSSGAHIALGNNHHDQDIYSQTNSMDNGWHQEKAKPLTRNTSLVEISNGVDYEKKSNSISSAGLTRGSETDGSTSSTEDFSEIDRIMESTKSRIRQHTHRSPTERTRLTGLVPPKFKDSLKTTLNGRRTITTQPSTTPGRSTRRWQ